MKKTNTKIILHDKDFSCPEFNAVWQVIKKWDIDRGDLSTSERCNYSGATGSDVMKILDALRSLNPMDLLYLK